MVEADGFHRQGEGPTETEVKEEINRACRLNADLIEEYGVKSLAGRAVKK
jgi:hypothetical protein